MDFIGGLPKACGVDIILVVIDRLTKYAHCVAIAHPYTAKDVAVVFVKEIIRLHGFPSSIVTDKDRVFMSSFWMELFKPAGTRLKYSSAYHPNWIGKQRLLTAIWRLISSVSQEPNPSNSLSGLVGQNIGSTPTTTGLLRSLPSRLFMGKIHRPL